MAANRIKGITVEIGGDTTGLSKALQSVNNTIKNTQDQLKDVNRLLKLDPSNTELVAQKQKLLKEAVGSTKEKLEALKTAQQQAKQQLENGTLGQEKYDALQREIVETEEELRRLQQEAANTGNALTRISEAGQKLEKIGGAITGVGKAVMPISAAVAGVGVAAVKTTADFDTAMSQVAAISSATGDDFDALRAKAREMGAETKFSAAEAAEAMNYMAMAGWKTGDMLGGISGIMNLAAASGESLGSTSDIVTDALTAFGMSADESGHFADVLAATAANANTNVAMMGETFKYAAPVAGALGYSVEDVSLAAGLMGNAGIKASEAGTTLRNIFSRMAKPTKESAAAMDRLGISLADEEGRMYSFREIMDQLRESFGHINMPLDEFQAQVAQLDADLESGAITEKAYGKELEELARQAFGAEGAEKARAAAMLAGQRGMSGLLAIVNASAEDYNKLAGAIDNADGSAEEMAGIMQDNLAGQLTILKSQLQELAISFGDMLMPVIRDIVTWLQGFVDKLNGMSESQRNAILKIGLFVAALGPFLVTVGSVITKVGMVMQGFAKLAVVFGKIKTVVAAAGGVLGKLGIVLGGVSAPVLAVIAVVAALAAGIVYLWNTNEGFRNAVLKIWEKIRSGLLGFVDGIRDGFTAFGTFLTTFGENVKTKASAFLTALITAVSNGLKAAETGIRNVFSSILTTAVAIWTKIHDAIIEPVEKARDAVKTAIDKMRSFFDFKWSLPKLKMPHIEIEGRFSLNPPSAPHFDIEWYRKGGILTRPTLFGMNGSSLMAGGEAGAEAVLPLKGFYDNLSRMLDERLNMGVMEQYLSVIADNSSKGIYLEDGTLVGRLLPEIDAGLANYALRGGRGNR